MHGHKAILKHGYFYSMSAVYMEKAILATIVDRQAFSQATEFDG